MGAHGGILAATVTKSNILTGCFQGREQNGILLSFNSFIGRVAGMALVRIDRLQPGMVLDDDVRDQSGRMLLRSGVELAEKHLTVLKAWGVTEVMVVGDVGETDAALPGGALNLDSEQLAMLHDEVAARFSGATDHPAVAELIRLCVARRARLLQSGSPVA